MNAHVRSLLDRISALEQELSTELHSDGQRLDFRTVGARVEFSDTVRAAHRGQKMGLLRWLSRVRPLNLLAVPILYAMIVPLLLMDLSMGVYQAICFPLFGIGKVRRRNYLAIDHHHLAYLNVIEKLNCIYCSYGNGLLAYAREIAARTEQYFCPIKHARQVSGTHARYARFLDYGDATDFHAKAERLRRELVAERARRRPAAAITSRHPR